MRVFAIAQFGGAVAIDRKHVRKQLLLIGKGEPLADHTVISRRCRIGFCRTFAAEVIAGFAVAFLQLGNQGIIIGRIGQDRHKGVVFGCATDHRRPANVDILDDFIARCAFGHRLRKRIEVHHHKVDGANMVLGHGGDVFGIIAHREEAAMHHRMQCLDAAVHHLGKASKLADVLHRQASGTERFGRPARRHQFDMARRQRMAQL